MANQETKIQNDIRVELSEIGIVRRNNVGLFITRYGAPIKDGIPGESDLTLFAENGKTVFIETKTPVGKQSKKQKNFQKKIEAMGFDYLIMRSVEDAKEFVRKWKNNEY